MFVARSALILRYAAVLIVSMCAQPLTSWAGDKSPATRADGTSVGNWYSIEKEKQIGAEMSANLERSNSILHDPATDTYLDQLTQTLTRNSRSQMPVVVRVIDRNEAYAETLPGGYQYVTRGLLLRVQNEGELASALARGVAHTELRSATATATRSKLMSVATIPLILVDDGVRVNSTQQSNLGVSLTYLKFGRQDELNADYLAAQYLYKSGYDPKILKSFILNLWPLDNLHRTSVAFSAFPPSQERLKAIDEEISKRLPSKPRAIVDTAEFARFRAHLLSLEPPKSDQAVQTSAKPTLLRQETDSH